MQISDYSIPPICDDFLKKLIIIAEIEKIVYIFVLFFDKMFAIMNIVHKQP